MSQQDPYGQQPPSAPMGPGFQPAQPLDAQAASGAPAWPAQPAAPAPGVPPVDPNAPAWPPAQQAPGTPAPAQPAPGTPPMGQGFPPAPGFDPNQPPPGVPPMGQGFPPAPGFDPNQPGMAMPPYGAPGYGQAPAPKKSKTGLIIVIAVVVVALIAAAVGLYFVLFAGAKDDPTKPVTAGQAKTPAAAVRGYIEALAAGNAEDALSFSATPPSDKTFLTDAMLASSNAINPIANVTETTPDNPGTIYVPIQASYTIGDQRVNTTFYVTKYDKYYMIDSEITSDVSMYFGLGSDGPALSLNGVSIPTSLTSATLFPGTYNVTSDNALLEVTNGQFTVTDPSSYFSTSSMDVALTSDATAKFAAAAKNALSSCMNEKATLTSCGFGADAPTSGGKTVNVDTNTIKWYFAKGYSSDFSDAEFDYYGYSNAYQATAYESKSMYFELDDRSGNSYSSYNYYIYKVTVDFTDPDNFVVTFS